MGVDCYSRPVCSWQHSRVLYTVFTLWVFTEHLLGTRHGGLDWVMNKIAEALVFGMS